MYTCNKSADANKIFTFRWNYDPVCIVYLIEDIGRKYQIYPHWNPDRGFSDIFPKSLAKKTRSTRDFLMIGPIVLTGYQRLTDWQTEGQTCITLRCWRVTTTAWIQLIQLCTEELLCLHFLRTYSFTRHFFLFWFTILYIHYSLSFSLPAENLPLSQILPP